MYLHDDVLFVMRIIAMLSTSVEDKERLMQSRQMHYSDMISEESAPSAAHKSFYARALSQNRTRKSGAVQARSASIERECT
ncbi:tellurite-like stress resistance cysteine protease StiP, partial [Pseudomonas syringae pv. tagetis]|uniref:cysteine protease StiP domain-containing protein n=1 Tax=Pseudomonas syringae group genomosp. 7 TaxID=251699 RepID=UPI003770471D